MDKTDNSLRAAHLPRARRRQHAPRKRRHPRAALAQGGRMGLRHLWRGARYSPRLRRRQLCRRPQAGRPVVLPQRRAALAAGPGQQRD